MRRSVDAGVGVQHSSDIAGIVTPPPVARRTAPSIDPQDPSSRVAVTIRAADVVQYMPYSPVNDQRVSTYLKMHGLDQLQLEALYRHRRSMLRTIVETTHRDKKVIVEQQVSAVQRILHDLSAMRAMIEIETQQMSDGIVRRLRRTCEEQEGVARVSPL